MDGNVKITGILRSVVNSLNRKTHAEKGMHFLTSATTCPNDDYYGFIVGSSGATITRIDYGEYSDLYTGDITAFSVSAGGTYLVKFKTITISAGTLICLKG